MIRTNIANARLEIARTACLFVAMGLLQIASGCATRDCWCFRGPEPIIPVNSVLATWDPHLQTVTDTQRPGVQVHGLAGRVYLQSEDAERMAEAKGDMVVAMYDVTNLARGAEPKPLVQCTFGAKDLKQLLKKDMIGDGYTLFIPWENYRPEIKRVKIELAYLDNPTPEKQVPHYANSTVLNVDTQGTIAINTRHVTPLSNTAAATKK